MMRARLAGGLACIVAIVACGDPGSKSPADVVAADLYGMWLYEEGGTPQTVLQFVSRHEWMPELRGASDVYFVIQNETVISAGTFALVDGTLETTSLYDQVYTLGLSKNPIVEFGGETVTLARDGLSRRYERIDDCMYLWVADPTGGYVGIRDDQETGGTFNGYHAIVFDSLGHPHLLVGQAGSGAVAQYATTRGSCASRSMPIKNYAYGDLAISADDTLHFAYTEAREDLGPGSKVFYASRAADDGTGPLVDWQHTELADAGGATMPRIAVTPAGDPVVVYTDRTTNELVVARRDQGSWSSARFLPNPGWNPFNGLALQVDANGAAHVAYITNGLWVASDDRAGGFSQQMLPANGGIGEIGFVISADGTWHFALAAVDNGNDPTPGGVVLFHTLMYGRGAGPTSLTWRDVGIGSNPSLAVDGLGRAHIHTSAKLSGNGRGNLHTIVDGDLVERFTAPGTTAMEVHPPEVAAGASGQAALGGAGLGAQIRPDDARAVARIDVPISILINGSGTVRVPELGATCTSSCTVVAKNDTTIKIEPAWPGIPPVTGYVNCMPTMAADYCLFAVTTASNVVKEVTINFP